MTAHTTVLIVAGGELDPRTTAVPAHDLVIGADAGAATATALGLRVDVAVGDFDSLARSDLDAAVAAGTVIERHPADKDATDLELAMLAARAHGAARVVVLGVGGGRLDHLLGNLLLLAAPSFADLDIEAHVGDALVRPVHRHTHLRGRPGTLVTLLPVNGPARGVRTTGLRYALHGEELAPGTSRGVSNELVGPEAQVSVAAGTLLVIQPEPT